MRGNRRERGLAATRVEDGSSLSWCCIFGLIKGLADKGVWWEKGKKKDGDGGMDVFGWGWGE